MQLSIINAKFKYHSSRGFSSFKYLSHNSFYLLLALYPLNNRNRTIRKVHNQGRQFLNSHSWGQVIVKQIEIVK